jgi:hypothetical protein
MTSLNQFSLSFLNLIVLLLAFSPSPADDSGKSSEILQTAIQETRFSKIDSSGKPVTQPGGQKTWACVLDNDTALIWEVKTRDNGLQDAAQTYSWYVTNPKINGGSAGYENHGRCSLALCNTQAYIDAVNNMRLCGRIHWRLPTREELRSIVDYRTKYPGPTINQQYFPNTKNQFYWSSVPDANDNDSAWGIGFSFGYDYAYFKSNLGYVRLVSGPEK